mmetsp:Transcript_6794/g.21119  ORF Transcript_6794/g.21119 Transcript_6794/m.21119 type:complete len:82 (-) Transcript_6794:14-259(-)
MLKQFPLWKVRYSNFGANVGDFLHTDEVLFAPKGRPGQGSLASCHAPLRHIKLYVVYFNCTSASCDAHLIKDPTRKICAAL